MDPNLFQRASYIVEEWSDAGCTEPLTYKYKETKQQTCFVDIFLPSKKAESRLLPVVLYLHAGGMTVGNRRSWFPTWMFKRAVQAGYIFATADYRLMPPATGNDIIDDIRDLFRFLAEDLEDLLASSLAGQTKIDSKSILVAGSSAGSYCAYLAALHAQPRPIGVLSLYGMGGNVLTSQYLSIKKEPFFMGREMLDTNDFREYLFPFSTGFTHTADSRLAYDPQSGMPANPRMQLCRLLLQQGVWLDYFTGDHDERDEQGQLVKAGLGTRLREAIDFQSTVDPSYLQSLVPKEHLHLFPQFNITSDFPPTFLAHGAVDSAVKVAESENLKRLLEASGVKVHFRVVPGQEHSFDYGFEPEQRFSGLFDDMFEFVALCFASAIDNTVAH